MPSELRKRFHNLYLQMSHASPHALQRMVLRAYPEADKKGLQDVVDGHTCECKKWARARHRPVVRMPKGPHFNDSVAIGLVFVAGLLVFHVIHLFTRFSAAFVMPTKAAADSEQAWPMHGFCYVALPWRCLPTLVPSLTILAGDVWRTHGHEAGCV